MELVEQIKGGVYTDSSMVARKFGQKHAYIVRTIEQLCEELRVISNHPCFPTKEPRNYRGTDYTAYLMDREFFSLLAMRFKGKEALEWQVKFNRAFYAMEEHLIAETLNKRNDQWVLERKAGKQIRLATTDSIKEFVDYATDQGSKSAKFYYKHITNATYKSLGLLIQRSPKVRDTMDLMEISQLALAEVVIQRALQKYLKQQIPYKVIYTMLVEDLNRFADSLLLRDT